MGFSLVVVSRDYSLVVCRLLIAAASGYRAQALGTWASVAFQSWALEHRFSSCGLLASLFCGMWDLPGSGIEPKPPVLTGGVFTRKPPNKVAF